MYLDCWGVKLIKPKILLEVRTTIVIVVVIIHKPNLGWLLLLFFLIFLNKTNLVRSWKFWPWCPYRTSYQQRSGLTWISLEPLVGLSMLSIQVMVKSWYPNLVPFIPFLPFAPHSVIAPLPFTSTVSKWEPTVRTTYLPAVINPRSAS